MKSLGLKFKIFFGLSSILFVLFGTSVYFLYSLSNINGTNEQALKMAYKNVASIYQLKLYTDQLNSRLTSVNLAYMNDEESSKVIEYISQRSLKITETIEAYEQQLLVPNNKKSFSEMKKNWEDFNKGIETLKKYLKSPSGSLAVFIKFKNEEFDLYSYTFDEGVSNLLNIETKQAEELKVAATNTSARVRIFIISMIIGALVFSCMIAFYLQTELKKILRQMQDFSMGLKEGRLDASIVINTNDEIGALAKNFNETVQYMKNIFNSDKIDWQEISRQRENEMQSQIKIKEALSEAEVEKATAIEAKRIGDQEKKKAEEAMVVASEEKKRAEKLASSAEEATEDLKIKVNKILSIVRSAEQGDLSQSTKIAGEDAIAQLSKGLDHFFEKLSEDISLIDKFAKNLEIQSQELQTKTTILDQNAVLTDDLSVQMSDHTKRVIDNIRYLNSSTSELKQAVQEISRQANETNRFTVETLKHVDSVKVLGAKLEENSNDISEFISMITTIARQTNLLALNATIEAARAGEHGKGFAVVANEVKELARQSAHAAEEITNKVNAIKDNSQNLTLSIDQVNAFMENINQAIRVVASATEEQTATTDQFIDLITSSVKEVERIESDSQRVNASAVATTAVVKDNTLIAQQLGQTSEQLNFMVKKFKLIDEQSNPVKLKAA